MQEWRIDIAASGEFAAADLQEAIERERSRPPGRANETDPPPSPSPPAALRTEATVEPVTDGVPEVPMAGLTAAVLRQALDRNGVLLVRGLMDPARAERMAVIATAACSDSDDYLTTNTLRAGSRFVPLHASNPTPLPADMLRRVAHMCKAAQVGEWPGAFGELMGWFAESRLVEVVGEVLGERPALAFEKTVVRDMPISLPPPTGLPDWIFPGWHQDGRTWPEPGKVVDAWVAFEPCGGTSGARGLELVPRRIDRRLPEWVDLHAHAVEVRAVLDRCAPVHPLLGPGDGLLFDGRLLHRSAGGTHYSRSRTSAECWFFAPSTFPGDLSPLALRPPGSGALRPPRAETSPAVEVLA